MSQAILTRCRRSLPCVASAAVRQLSSSTSSTSPVDQMLEYAMAQRKSNPDMAVDVLMSGLSYTSPAADPLGSARLHLAIAQLEADRNRWSQAQAQAGSCLRLAAASVPTSPAGAELALAAGGLATRALLLLGQDGEALSVASDCERALRAAAPAAAASSSATSASASASASSSSPAAAAAAPSSAPHVRSLGILALASRTAAGAEGSGGGGTSAAAAAASAAAGQLEAALGPDVASSERLDPSLADAAQALGLLRALQGRKAEAEAALAAAAAAAARAGAGAAPLAGADWAWQQHNSEVTADALTGRAQLLMRAREWGEAEEVLGEALKAAEAAHGDRSPSLAPLLTLLGYTYSRSARVTFAEGLFREAAKLLRLDPARVLQQQQQQQQQAQQQVQAQQAGEAQQQQQAQQQPPSHGGAPEQVVAPGPSRDSPLLRVAADSGVHGSTAAVLAWRYAQLLWVLPNRGGEASRWEGCARSFWSVSGDALAGRGIEEVLGGQGHLRGEGPEGSGLLLSTRFRRAWPCDADK